MFTKKMSFKQIFTKITFALAAFMLIAVVSCKKTGSEVVPEEEKVEIVSPTDSASVILRADCAGTISATFNGVAARQNCPVGSANVYGYNYETGINTGYKWQCVEYINRYYYKVYGMDLKSTGIYGNAKNYYEYSNHTAIGLAKYANGGSVAPQVGDILVSTYGTYGHVAIVTSVSSTSVGIIDQNFSSNSARTLTRSGNTVGSFGSSYTVAGWVRKASIAPAQTPTLSTPAANTSNLSGNINFSWSCPNATEYRIQIIDAALYKGFNAAKGFVNAAGAEATDCAYNQNIGNQTSFVWTNAQRGKTYYWTVRANNSGGASSFTSMRSFTTAASLYCNLSSTSPISATAATGSSTISVSANTTWSVSSNATSWCTISPASGNGNGSFRISWSANSTTSTRYATISITSPAGNKTISVSQAGASVYCNVGATSYSVASTALYNGLSTTVSTNASSWTVQSQTSWISVTKLNNSFTVSCQTNTTIYSRTGSIVVNAGGISRTVTITQAAAPISLTVSPTSRSITSAAVNNGLSTTVSTNAPSWTVQSQTSWISVTKLNNGFTVSCQANTTIYSRTGTILVNANGKTQTVTITQARR